MLNLFIYVLLVNNCYKKIEKEKNIRKYSNRENYQRIAYTYQRFATKLPTFGKNLPSSYELFKI